MSDFRTKRNEECRKTYKVRFVSFEQKTGRGYTTLSIGLGQEIEPWHLDLLQEFIDEHREEDFGDLV